MKTFKIFLLIIVALSLSACAPKFVSKEEAYPGMYKETPTALLVLPPINQSTAAEAKEFYNTTIAQPLTLRGYYVYPIEVVTEMLEYEGIYSTESLLNFPPEKFKEYFNADAALFIVINKWDTSYYVIGGNVQVEIAYILKSTETGETIWRYRDSIKVDTAGDNHGGGIAGLVLQVVETAVKTAMTDYVPIAQRVNNMALNTIPVGAYHPAYGKDMQARVVPEKQVKP